MTTATLTTCSDCGKELRVSYENEPLPAGCIHQVLGSKEDPCSQCKAAFEMALEKWLATAPICAACAEGDEREAQLKARREEEGRWLEAAGIPDEFCGLGWTDLIQSGKRAAAIAAAVTWANADAVEARGLYLWGPTGTGKSTIAATAAWHRLHEKRAPLRWVSVALLIARLESSFSDSDRQQALKVLTGDGAIVLDDVDKLNPSEGKRAQLFAAIDRRVTAGAPMLVTGNLSPSKLEDKLGDAIASRVLGYCLTRTFEVDGPDRRMSLGDI